MHIKNVYSSAVVLFFAAPDSPAASTAGEDEAAGEGDALASDVPFLFADSSVSATWSPQDSCPSTGVSLLMLWASAFDFSLDGLLTATAVVLAMRGR